MFDIYLRKTREKKFSLYIHPTFLHYEHVYVLSCFSCVWFFVTLWTVAHQVSLSLGFSRQEYWSGLPCPPPGSELESLNFCIAGGFFTTSTTWKADIFLQWNGGAFVRYFLPTSDPLCCRNSALKLMSYCCLMIPEAWGGYSLQSAVRAPSCPVCLQFVTSRRPWFCLVASTLGRSSQESTSPFQRLPLQTHGSPMMVRSSPRLLARTLSHFHRASSKLSHCLTASSLWGRLCLLLVGWTETVGVRVQSMATDRLLSAQCLVQSVVAMWLNR